MRSAVVVGAGVGGLAAAGALARSGWSVTLLERGDRLRPGRAALVLWPNGLRALRALGLGGGLDAIATALPGTGLRRPDGHWLVPPNGDQSGSTRMGRGGARMVGSADGGECPVVVHGEDLHDAFIAGLGERVDVRTGIDVRAVRPVGDRPSVGDGRATWEGDVVVAADGVNSLIRKRLAPATTPISGGSACWRAVIPWYRAPQLAAGTPPSGEVLGAGQRFLHATLGERASAGRSSPGGIYWTATVPGAHRPEPPEAQLVLLRRWFAGWPAPVSDLLAATDTEDLVQDRVVELRPMPEFAHPTGTGGYVLLGDAAHSMTHHLGQGASLALEDAATLQALLHDAIPARTVGLQLAEYGRVRRPRALRVAQQSRRVGAVLQERGRLLTRARNAALSTFAPRLLDRATTGAAQWQPPGV